MLLSTSCALTGIYLPFLLFLGIVTAQAIPSTSKAVQKRRVRDLKTRPQVRKTFPPESELRALARSVMKRQIHPLIISGENFLYDGECRYRGLMLENPDFEVDVIVVDHELSAAEICELQMISAMHSTSLNAYDQAVACRDWLAQNPGATAKQLAEKIDRDPSTVTRLLALWTTIPLVIKAAEEGRVSARNWYSISQLPHAEQFGLLEMTLSGVPVAQLEQISRKKRQATVAAVRVNKFKYQLPGRDTIIQVGGTSLSLDDIIEALQELVKEAKRANDQGLDARTFQSVMRDKANA